MFKKLTALAMAVFLFAAFIPISSVLMPSEAYANNYNKPPPIKKDIPKIKTSQKVIKKDVIKKGGVSGIGIKKISYKKSNVHKNKLKLSKKSTSKLKNLKTHTAVKYLSGPALPLGISKTFKNGVYANKKLDKDTNFFRYHGVDNRTGRKFSWLSNKKYSSESEMRAHLAIRQDWGVSITRVSTFLVPKGTWVSEGVAAPQGARYSGGGYQVVISNLARSWLVRTDRAF